MFLPLFNFGFVGIKTVPTCLTLALSLCPFVTITIRTILRPKLYPPPRQPSSFYKASHPHLYSSSLFLSRSFSASAPPRFIGRSQCKFVSWLCCVDSSLLHLTSVEKIPKTVDNAALRPSNASEKNPATTYKYEIREKRVVIESTARYHFEQAPRAITPLTCPWEWKT